MTSILHLRALFMSDLSDPNQETYRYWAFISYSHRDKRWGDWLHKGLETYRVPTALVGKVTPRGYAVPTRLFPIFRDREELPTAASLSENIQFGLENARYLVVICSPRSAASIWVNEEIKYFKSLGREDRILPLIVDGEPNAADKPDLGLEECFPEALKYRWGQDGLTTERTEPIAADARNDKDGKANALLKLLAGLLGVNFDTLFQREQRRRRQRLMVVAVVTTLLFTLISGLGFFSYQQWQLAEEKSEAERIAKERETQAKKETQVQLKKANHNLGMIFREKAEDSFRKASFPLYALHALLRIDENEVEVRNELAAKYWFKWSSPIVPVGATPIAAHQWGGIESLAFSPDGTILASSGGGFTQSPIRLWNVKTGELLRELTGHTSQVTRLLFSPDGTKLTSWGTDEKLGHWDVASGRGETIEIKVPGQAAKGASLSRDGRIIAVTSYDYVVLREVRRGMELGKLSAGLYSNFSASDLCPDGRRVITAGLRGLTMWDMATKQETASLAEEGVEFTRLICSPGGAYLAAADDTGTLHLWHLPNQKKVATLRGHNQGMVNTIASDTTPQITSLTFSDDCTRLASGGDDHTIRIWETVSGRELGTLRGHGARVNALAFSPDGQRLAAGGEDNILRLWDLATGQPIGSPPIGHADMLFAVAFSPDGQRFASGGADHTIRLWHTASGREEAVLRGHTHRVRALVFSPDGQTLLSGSEDGTLRIWEVATGQLQTTLNAVDEGGKITTVAFSPDNETLAAGGEKPSLRLWARSTGQMIADFTAQTGAIQAIAFSPDGQTLASGSHGPNLHLWDMATHTLGATLSGHTKAVNALAFFPDGKTLVSTSEDGTTRFWELPSGVSRSVHKYSSEQSTLALSRDGRRVVTEGAGQLTLMETMNGQVLDIWQRPSPHIETLAISPDGFTLVITSKEFFQTDAAIKLLDLSNDENHIRLLDQEPVKLHRMFLSSMEDTLVSIHSGGTIRLWDMATGLERTSSLRGIDGTPTHALLTPDGRILATLNTDGIAQLSDVNTGELRATLQGHTKPISDMALSPDSQILATGSQDGTIRLWEVASGRAMTTLSGHPLPIMGLAFSPDGRILASGSQDTTIRLWEVAIGREQGVWHGHTEGISAMVFSPDGRTLASGGDDSTLRFWNVDSGEQMAEPMRFEGSITRLQYSPDGQLLALVLKQGTFHLLQSDTRRELPVPSKMSDDVAFSQKDGWTALGSRLGLDLWNLEILQRTDWSNLIALEEQRSGLHMEGTSVVEAPLALNLYGNKITPPLWSANHPFHWLPKAEAGDGEAMLQMGLIHHRRGAWEEARGWYDKALAAGHPQAARRLEALASTRSGSDRTSPSDIAQP